MGDFGEIYYHVYTVIFTTLGKMTDADRVINPQHFAIFGAMRQTSGSESGNLDSNHGSFLVDVLALAEVCAL